MGDQPVLRGQGMELGAEGGCGEDDFGLGGGEAGLEVGEVLGVAGRVAGDGDDSGIEAGIKGGDEF